MNGTVREWVEKAEGDLRTAQREFRALDRPNYDAVCFHAQQCVEKLMKALLMHHQITPPRTHDLERLFDLLKPVVPTFAPSVEDIRSLTTTGMAVRYPDESADQEDARQALEICERLRGELLGMLGEERE